MKSIFINKNQEDKLLEMARDLFKDDAECAWGSSSGIEFDSLTRRISFYHDCGTERIHWFEFCIIHLARKIFYLENGNTVWAQNAQITFNNNCLLEEANPTSIIDYLYERYKNITKDVNNKQPPNNKRRGKKK